MTLQLIVIGVIKDENGAVIGYRLFDKQREIYMDKYAYMVAEFLRNGLPVEGLELRDKKIVGSNGSLERYPVIVRERLVGKSPFIVLARLQYNGETVGYKVCDWRGITANVSLDEAIKYASIHGVANGYIKEINGKYYLSSINGEYENIELKTALKNKDLYEDIENTVWTLKDFVRFMRYDYTSFEILPTDDKNAFKIRILNPDVKIIKYPMGVASIIGESWFSVPLNAEIMIVPPCVKAIGKGVLKYLPKLKKIVFQEGITELELSGLDGANVESKLSEIKFPSTLKQLRDCVKHFKSIQEIDLSNTSIEYISNSFWGLPNLRSVKLPLTLREIYESFIHCPNLKDIDMPINVSIIHGHSFRNSGITNLDLSKCSLHTIGAFAFTECRDLTSIKFPKYLNYIVDYAFRECLNLAHVDLPQDLIKIGYQAFSNTLINKVKIPEKVGHIGKGAFNPNTVIEVDVREEIPNAFIQEPGYETVILPEGLKVIGTNAFEKNTNLKAISIPKTVKIIGSHAFADCTNLEKVEFDKDSELNVIGSGAFKGTQLRKVILPEGLVEIGDYCFNSCPHLMYVVLPKSLKKIGKDAFYNTGYNLGGLGTTFLVYRNSEGLRYCKRKGYRYNIIDSLDDLHFLDDKESEKDQKIMARMQLLGAGDPNVQEILSPKYKNHAVKLFQMYMNVGMTYEDKYDIKLNTEKFIDFPVEKIGIVDEFIKKARSENGNYNKIHFKEVPTRFKVLCNYITAITNFTNLPLTSKSLIYLEEKDRQGQVEKNVVYMDKNNAIVTFHVIENNEAQKANIIVVIVMNDRIKYVSVVDCDASVKTYITYPEKILKTDYSFNGEFNDSMARYLKENDALGESSSEDIINIINGIEVPKFLFKLVMDNLKQHLIPLAHKTIRSAYTTGETYYDACVYAVCLNTGTLIKFDTRTYNKITRPIRDITTELSGLQVAMVTTFDDLDKETIADILSFVSSENALRLYSYITYGDVWINKLKQSNRAYDHEPCKEWKIARKLIEDDRWDVNGNWFLRKDTVQEILNTYLYEPTRRNVAHLAKTALPFMTMSLDPDGTEKLVEYQIYGREYLVGIFNKDEKKKIMTFYKSKNTFRDNLISLSALYKDNANPKIEDYVIRNEIIDQDLYNEQYKTIEFLCYASNGDISYSIDVCRNSGAVYLNARCKPYKEKARICNILRFRSIDDAFKHFGCLREKGYLYNDRSTLLIGEMDRLCFEIFYGVEDTSWNNIKIIREEVMSGLPNGVYTRSNELALFNDVAKQSIKTI